MLLLNLDFADVAWVLNDLGNVCLVSSSNLTGNALSQVREPTIHPVLPEDTNTVTEGREVRLNHTECSVDGPEDEEYDKKVMSVPETLEIGTSRLLCSCQGNSHQCDKHNITTPSGTCCKIGQNEAHEAELVDCGKLCEIVPMGDRVNPGKEDD